MKYLALAGCVVFLGPAASSLAAPVIPEDYTMGVPWLGPAGVREKVSEIMERDARQGGKKSAYRERLRKRIELPEFIEEPDGPAPSPPTEGLTGQGVGLNFLGATLADTLAYPPDSMGAAGPSQYIVCVNGRIRSFNKATGVVDGVINADTDVFFQSVMTPPVANNFTSDPRIRYDRLSQRWFVVMIDVPNKTGASPNRIMIAVSDGPVITGSSSWTFYYFRHDLVAPAGDSNEFADYPTLGIDANALYIGVNIFATRGQGSFDNTTAFAVRKSSLLVTNNAPTNILVSAFRGLVPNGQSGGPYTPQGVDNYAPNANEGYVIGATSTHVFLVFGELSLRRITNVFGTNFAISSTVHIPVALNGGTINVPHLGNTGGSAGNLDGLDYRLLAAHIRNGRLWTSENIAVDNNGSPSGTDTRMGMRWYELSGIGFGQTPSVVQSGTVFQPSAGNTSDQRCYWMGTVMVSGQGHAAMGFSVAGANEYINAGWAGRLAGDALNTMRSPALYTATSSAYNPRDGNGNPIERWGDYSYTCLDPNDDMTMWTIQQFCDAPNSYGVQVAKLLAPPPATPTNCSPSSLVAGTSNVNVLVTGMTDGDTGFFDPGTGFSNRISAVVNGGGVIVNSISYSNPTHITLNLSVAAGATAGGRSLTVINPDGQSASSASGILTVIGGGTNSPPSLAAISNKTINEGTSLTFTNSATDPNGDTLSYSLDPGAPAGASVNPTNGVFTWTPTEAQGPGITNITVRVTDSGLPPLSDAKTFSVVVNEVNSAPALSAISDRTITEGSLLTITNSATDSDIPANTLTYSLVPGAPAGASVNPTNGVFNWTPSETQGPGTNIIAVRVTDNGSPSLSATQSFTVVVLESNGPPVLAAIASRTIHQGTTLTITNTATDPDVPTNTLTFSLDTNAPAGATIDALSGVFAWTPATAYLNTTNTITVHVTDNGAPNLSDAKSFLAVVVPPPVIQSIVLSNGVATISWTAITGQAYQLQYKNDLAETNWTDLLPEVVAAGAVASKADSFGAALHRFYRVQVVP